VEFIDGFNKKLRMKYIYNITYHIEEAVFPQWQEWIRGHMSRSLQESHFSGLKLLQIHIQEVGSKAFSLQYEATNKEAISYFQSVLEEHYRKELFLQFGEKVLTFATLLEVTEELKRD
jgi:hypothetical protein